MCGKFYIDDETRKLVGSDDQKDQLPSDQIAVIISHQGKLVSVKMEWGYTHPLIPQRIINAKCETILEKKMFKDDVLYRRCVIPSKGFYEWDQAHHQISFESKNDKQLFMAGIYHDKQVVIITTKANEVMKPIHSRMPLFISKQDMKDWLTNPLLLDKFLKQTNDEIKIVSGHLQQTLFE